jgi:site-specific DNA recombinase
MTQKWATYTRVSTEDQAQAGVSLDSQLAACRAFAMAKGWQVGEEVCDPGASGSSLKRPGAQRLLELIRKREVAGVVVWRLDRLTRSIRDLLDLLALAGDQVGIVSVTESLDTTTPMGRFTTHLLGIIAQWERETIGARTSSAMEHIKAKGYYTGGRKPPAGCVVVPDGDRKRLVAGPDADAVRAAWPLILAGGGLRQVCDHMRAAGVPGDWTPSAARNLLLSPLVVDLLVDGATQLAVRTAMAGRASPRTRGGKMNPKPIENASPLRGLIRCPTCDASMVQVTANGHGGAYRYFRCTARIKSLCEQKDVRCEPVERAVIEAVVDACQNEGGYRAMLMGELTRARGDLVTTKAERATLTAERDQLSARVSDLTLHTQIGTSVWAESMKALGRELERIDSRLAQLAGSIAVAEIDQGSLDMVLADILGHAQRLPSLSMEEQAKTLHLLIQRARIMGDSVQIDLYYPESAASQKGNDLDGVTRPGSLISRFWLPGAHGVRTMRLLIRRRDRPLADSSPVV